MGEYAEMMLDGTLCECCGVYIEGDGDGIPRYCSPQCARDRGRSDLVCDEPRRKPKNRGEKVRLQPTRPQNPQAHKPWRCECGKRFHTETAARQHYRTIHGGQNG